MQERIKEELSYLIESIDKEGEKPVKIHAILGPSLMNVTSQLVFGHRYEVNDPKFILLDKFLDTATDNVPQTGLLVNSPFWLGSLLVKVGIAGNQKILNGTLSMLE